MVTFFAFVISFIALMNAERCSEEVLRAPVVRSMVVAYYLIISLVTFFIWMQRFFEIDLGDMVGLCCALPVGRKGRG